MGVRYIQAAISRICYVTNSKMWFHVGYTMMLPIYWVTALHEEGNVVLQKYHNIAGGIKHTVYETQAIVLVE